MGLLRAMVLSLVFAIAALIAVAETGTQASASMPAIEQSIEFHASASLADYCKSGMPGKHGASHEECCGGMNCGQSGIAALMAISAPVCPPLASQNVMTAARIVGRTIVPDTDPPKPLV